MGGVALHVLLDRALLVEVGERADPAHIGEAHRLAFQLGHLLLFEEGQPEILEDHGRQLVERDLRFIVVRAGLFARLPLLAAAGAGLRGDHIADLAVAVAFAGVLLAAGVVAEPIFL